jgi:DMSO/TMAO reductase YedYZ molybdopterin-dependent catalytic subunit/thiosulfate reductase cytochrome b subunit
MWLIPLVATLLIAGVVISQELREISAVEEFIALYPGSPPSAPDVGSGFPAWLRWQHFLNLFFMMFIIRAGLQILADHPRLYWRRDSTPGTEWFRFQHEVPKDRIWTAKDDSVTLPTYLGIPGKRHTVGLARWWHFTFDLLWLINGAIFYVLLFTTDQWQRLIPTSWEVIPNALSTLLQYLSLDFPANDGWLRYNSLQQLAYFLTVFLAAPLAVITGLMQAPAIGNKLGWLGRNFNRQAARSIHFLVLCWFLFFICIHVTMVAVTGLRRNLNHMFYGVNSDGPEGLWVAGIAMTAVITAWVLASPLTLRNARLVQQVGEKLLGLIKGLGEWWDVSTQYTETDISPRFWPNGKMPTSEEFDSLVKGGFSSYRLLVSGLVEMPREFTYAEIKAMPKQEQITCHFCIQGWTGVAKWGGVPMRHVLELVRPKPEARYVVFYSYGEGGECGRYYDVHRIGNMRHELTLLAYEMNGRPLTVLYGAPLRLRCENELGFKMVKWIEAIEFVESFTHLGAGQGGYNEDHEFFGYRMPI